MDDPDDECGDCDHPRDHHDAEGCDVPDCDCDRFEAPGKGRR
jgi:hypothetical protein